MTRHSNLTNVHRVYNYTYTTTLDMTSATGFINSDIGKVARVTSDDSLWMLVSTDPEWVSVSGATAGQLDGYLPSSTFNDFRAFQDETNEVILGALDGYAGNISTLEGDLSGLNTTVEQNVSALNDTTQHLRAAADGYGSDISTLQGDVSTLQGDVSDNTIDIISIDGRVTTNESDISTLQGDFSTLQGDVSDNNTSLQDFKNFQNETNEVVLGALDGYALDSDLTTAQGDITDLQSDFSGLNTTVEENVTSINVALRHSIHAADAYGSDIAGLDTQVDAIDQTLETILSELDGYTTPAGFVTDEAFNEFKDFQFDTNDSIIGALDSYGAADVINLQNSFNDFKDFQNETNDVILGALDGYLIEDGYVTITGFGDTRGVGVIPITNYVPGSDLLEPNQISFYTGGFSFSDEPLLVKVSNSSGQQYVKKLADEDILDGYVSLGNDYFIVDDDGYMFANKAIHTSIGSMYVPDDEAVIVDFSLSNSHFLSLDSITTNCAIDFAGGVAGGTYVLKIQNHATSAKTVTWGGDILFPGGTPTEITDTAGAIDIVSVFYDGVNWYASLVQDFSRTS